MSTYKSETRSKRTTTPDNMSVGSRDSRSRRGIRIESPFDYSSDTKTHSTHGHRSKRSRGGKDINVFSVVTRTSKAVSSRVTDLEVVKLLLSDPGKLDQVCSKVCTIFDGSENPLDLPRHSSARTILKALGGLIFDTKPVLECVSVVADWCEQEGKTVEYGISQDTALYLLLYTYFGDALFTPSSLLDVRMSTLCDAQTEIDDREKALFALYCKIFSAIKALPHPTDDLATLYGNGGGAPKYLYFGTSLAFEKRKNVKLGLGAKFAFPGFVSAVDDLETLAKIFPSDSGTVFEVALSKKNMAHCIQPFSLYPGIREYVIEPLTSFKVVSMRTESAGKVTIITAEAMESVSFFKKTGDVIPSEDLALLGSEILLGKTESGSGNDSSSVTEDDDDNDDDDDVADATDDKKKAGKSKKKDDGAKVVKSLRKNNKKAISPAKALVNIANNDLQTEYELDKEFFDVSCDITKRVIKSSKRLGHSAIAEKSTTMKMTSIPAGFGKFEG